MRPFSIWSAGFGLALSLLTVSGCHSDDITGSLLDRLSSGTEPVTTDAREYQLVRTNGAWRAYLRATYRNTTGRPVYFKRCMPESTVPLFGVRRTGPDSTRELFQDYGFGCVGGVPTGVLAPGDSLTITAPLGSVDQPFMQPPLRPEHLVGMMRVRFALCRKFEDDSDRCALLPNRQSDSNPFEVRY